MSGYKRGVLGGESFSDDKVEGRRDGGFEIGKQNQICYLRGKGVSAWLLPQLAMVTLYFVEPRSGLELLP
ncbi:hypothetical protein VNO80_03346 [Phaseolus coccineus]|uniref:Uncharacterized protein n=1 Tax=Phaseolus coccineus TaxID=3886 RepID=A0AAN9NRI2_PHACN